MSTETGRSVRRHMILATLTIAGVAALGAPAHAGAAFGSGAPGFVNYQSPLAPPSSNEPSIGVDWSTGAVMYQAAQKTDKVIFDDSTTPATATWTDVTNPTAVTTLDPILFTDKDTNRTFESQLLVACSDMGYSDNDGGLWVQSQGCGLHGAEDHQTVGGGPFHAPVPTPPAPAYPHAVYYCSQDFANGTAAFCSLSADGGITFGQPAVVYNFQTCGGLHGHLRVSPDGTAYLPNQGCFTDSSIVDPKGDQFSKQSVAVSSDDGATWTVLPIPDSRATYYSDPSVAAGSGNTVYFGYENGGTDGAGHTVPSAGGGHPMVAVSQSHGTTWSPSIDVGQTLTLPNGTTTPLGIQNTAFPDVIAGDDNRAAFAFLGSKTGGDYQASTFTGTWDLYVSMTYDGGATWTTVDATPGNPVQRGCIWLQGGSSPCRNMLDFNDLTVDKAGRVLAAYTKGCTGACTTDPAATNPHSAIPYIARQSDGIGLFANPGTPIPESRSLPLLILLGLVAAIVPARWRRLRRLRTG